MHLVEQQLQADWPPSRWSDLTVAVGVSGGADSVALLRALRRIRLPQAGRIVVFHVNHHLRGKESDGDELFVRDLAQRLGLEIEVGDCHLDSNAPDGLEATARAARYEFFEIALKRVGARYLALAHTADDQAETILHRVIRGTSLAGLAGIPRIRSLEAATVIRPLLNVRRSQLRDYLETLGQTFREDSSNADLSLTRNRIRAELLPLLESYHPKASEALIRLGQLSREAHAILEQLATALYRRAVTVTTNEVIVRCDLLAAEQNYVVREMFVCLWQEQGWALQAMGYEQWEQLAGIAVKHSRQRERQVRTFPGGIQLVAADGCLVLRKL